MPNSDDSYALCSKDKAEVRACAFLPNGSVATGAQNNKVLLFPPHAAGTAAAAVPEELLEHERTSRGLAGVTSITATANNQVVSAGKDGKVVVWNAVSPHIAEHVLGGGHSGSMTNAHVVATLCTSEDGTSEVISGGWDTNVSMMAAIYYYTVYFFLFRPASSLSSICLQFAFFLHFFFFFSPLFVAGISLHGACKGCGLGRFRCWRRRGTEVKANWAWRSSPWSCWFA